MIIIIKLFSVYLNPFSRFFKLLLRLILYIEVKDDMNHDKSQERTLSSIQ
jgi:hypothetical protein